MSLTAPERETVITFSDEDGTATIHTHQRRIITKLRNNPAAQQIEDISFDGTAGAVFELPADLISFRSKKRQGRELSTAERAERVRQLHRARAKAASVASEPDFHDVHTTFSHRDPLWRLIPRANGGWVPNVRLSEGSQPATAYGGSGPGFPVPAPLPEPQGIPASTAAFRPKELPNPHAHVPSLSTDQRATGDRSSLRGASAIPV